jgi:hypothetical protein
MTSRISGQNLRVLQIHSSDRVENYVRFEGHLRDIVRNIEHNTFNGGARLEGSYVGVTPEQISYDRVYGVNPRLALFQMEMTVFINIGFGDDTTGKPSLTFSPSVIQTPYRVFGPDLLTATIQIGRTSMNTCTSHNRIELKFILFVPIGNCQTCRTHFAACSTWKRRGNR